MSYRQCSRCNVVTDEDEIQCPGCGKNHIEGRVIVYEGLIFSIKKGEIVLSSVWTKKPDIIYRALKSLP